MKKERVFRKEYETKKYEISLEKRSNKGTRRFGGGWQIEFGFQIGTNSLIINLFVMSIRINRKEVKL